MRRRAAIASGFALLVSPCFVSRASAERHGLFRPVPTARAMALRRPVLLPSLRLTPWRELGVAGLNLRWRLPGPTAPSALFMDARLGDGIAAARPDGALMIPGTSLGVSGTNGSAGLMSTRGVDLGVDVRRWKGGYVSVALGWLRSTWPVGGLDAHGQQVATNLSVDGAVFKIGLSF